MASLRATTVPGHEYVSLEEGDARRFALVGSARNSFRRTASCAGSVLFAETMVIFRTGKEPGGILAARVFESPSRRTEILRGVLGPWLPVGRRHRSADSVDYLPQQCLYFRPLPQGHGSLRPVLGLSIRIVPPNASFVSRLFHKDGSRRPGASRKAAHHSISATVL